MGTSSVACPAGFTKVNVDLNSGVGAANARNPISIIVPCHRAIGADGRLNGYAGGVDRKAALLKLEGAWPPQG